jgi:hypothetical protein
MEKPMSSVSSNGSAGEWIADSLVWQQDGLLYFSKSYLQRSEYSVVVHPDLWGHWVKRCACGDLDQRVNRGRIRSLTVRGRRGRRTRVFLQADVKQIIHRRTDAQARTTDPSACGEWLSDDLFQVTRAVPEMGLAVGEVLCEAAKLASMGMTRKMVTYWRDRPNPSLDPALNGGRLRWLHIPKLCRGKNGLAKVYVYSRSDWKKILAGRPKLQPGDNGPRHGKTTREVARQLGLDYCDQSRGDQLTLYTVLRKFREEVPTGAWQAVRQLDTINQHRKVWHYDLPALRRWLGGRTVQAVAADISHPELPQTRDRRERRVQRGVAFLRFVLTQGGWSPREFGRFLAYPPAGEQLTPCDGVLSSDVKRWAREARVGWRTLWNARKRLPIRIERVKPSGQFHWRLTQPVVIPAAHQPATEPTTEVANEPALATNGTPATSVGQAKRRKRGRPSGVGGETKERRAKLRASWETGGFQSITEFAKYHHISRPLASGIVNDSL